MPIELLAGKVVRFRYVLMTKIAAKPCLFKL
jgi:hypothetical protein